MKRQLRNSLCNTGRNLTTLIFLPDFFSIITIFFTSYILIFWQVMRHRFHPGGAYGSSSHLVSSISEGQVLLQRGRESIWGELAQRDGAVEQLWFLSESGISPLRRSVGTCEPSNFGFHLISATSPAALVLLPCRRAVSRERR